MDDASDAGPADGGAALRAHVVVGRSESALELTCVMLKEQRLEALEEALLWLCARFGEGERAPTAFVVVQWRAICEEVAGIVERARWRVKEVLVLVAKLCLVFRAAGSAPPPLAMPKLRAAVLPLFPEGGAAEARLTARGNEFFARVLPEDAEERALAERVLVGLGQLWALPVAACDAPLRQAVEYLLRKKGLALHLPDAAWPCPSLDEFDKGDAAWFLWGAYMLRYPATATLWRLYTRGYRRGKRAERSGLLLGARWWALMPATDDGEVWSPSEGAIFAQVEAYALEMWRALHAADEVPPTPRDHIWAFTPRAGGGVAPHSRQEEPHDDAPPPPEPPGGIKRLSVQPRGHRGQGGQAGWDGQEDWAEDGPPLSDYRRPRQEAVCEKRSAPPPDRGTRLRVW